MAGVQCTDARARPTEFVVKTSEQLLPNRGRTRRISVANGDAPISPLPGQAEWPTTRLSTPPDQHSSL